MNGLLVLPPILILLFSTPLLADYQKGVDAAESGDYATALKEWKPLAERGDAKAQFKLGFMYYHGQGVPRDYKTAIKWYLLAAQQGDYAAQHNLGFMYQNGLGGTRNDKTAFKWFKLAAEHGAAEQGAAVSQYSLGVMYFTGKGVIKDYIRAHMWWDIAVKNGDQIIQRHATEFRDKLEKEMTSTQIKKAQNLVRECAAKDYKDC